MKSPVRDIDPVTESIDEAAESSSIRIDIKADSLPGGEVRILVSPYEPQVETIEALESWQRSDKVEDPDKKITLFALKLAFLEKVASKFGALAFIWATVVVLGGFAVTLETVDFWFVSIMLLIEGTRIFRQRREIEWQYEAMLISMASLGDDAKCLSRMLYNGSTSILSRIRRSFMKKIQSPNIKIWEKVSGVDSPALFKRVFSTSKVRLKPFTSTWPSSKIQFVPFTAWPSISKGVSRLFSWLQLLSAFTCVALSVYRLEKQDYSGVSGIYIAKNQKSALNIFYGLSLADALLYMLEKAYWHWKIIAGNLFPEVNAEYGFDHYELSTVRRFFYDTYSRCINGSVLDGSKMELVSYSVELLQSSSVDRQLGGARVLSKLAKNNRFAEETLKTIGTMQELVERLIEMLNWKYHHQQELRRAAAEIILNLVKIKCNLVQVTGIAGYVESIASLLYDAKEIGIHSRQYGDQFMHSYDYWGFSLLGLQILKSLANDHENSGKIGSSRCLLPKIISLTELKCDAPDSQIMAAEQALRLVGILANTTGATGKALRKGISETVCAISNLRDVLQISTHGLQIVAIDTLKSLALEEEGRERVGSASGVLHNLFSVFMMDINRSGDNQTTELVAKAGELLALLSLENEANCHRIMNIDLQDYPDLAASLSTVLDDPGRGLFAAKILRNLLAGLYFFPLRNKTVTAVQVVKFVVEKQGEHQEAAIGLAAQIFRSLTDLEFDHIFEESSGLTKRALILELVKVFQRHPRPSNEVPSIRRLSIELLIALMEKDSAAMEMRKELWEALEGVMETTSEMENYSTFAGSMGLSSHRVPIQTLVNSAKEWLRDENEANWRRIAAMGA